MNAASVVAGLSVGSPKWEDIRGHPVFTSIVREASSMPLDFGLDGLPGNMTAVHSEQVLAFSAEHYDHWAGVFGVPRAQWGLCHWGENLTLTGFDENELRIGDILEIGPDARFAVNGPRNPCFKLAWRLGQPDAVLRDMIARGFIGFYLTVLTPGRVAIGDAVVHKVTDPDAVTVGDLGRLLAGIAEADPERMRHILGSPALGGQARVMVGQRLATAEDGARTRIGRWTGWRPFEIAATIDEAEDIRSFELVPVDGGPVAPFRAGQFLTIRLSDSESGEGLSRIWSLSDYQDYPDRYRVTVKRAGPDGGSAWMHDVATVGRRVLVRPPAGRFIVDRGGFHRCVLISAGIGVTPMLAMLRAMRARGKESAPVLWIHVTRNGHTHVRAVETDALLEAQGYRRRIFYSDPLPEDVAGIAYDEVGRLTAARLTELVAGGYEIEPFRRTVAMEGYHSDFYICGPAAFETAMRESLSALGVAEGRIHSESFGAPVAAGRQPAVARAEVTIEGRLPAIEWTATEDMTLLELAESVGLQPPFACRQGQCGSCEVRLLSGDVGHDPMPIVPPRPGRLLLCCARPASAAVTIGL